MESFDELYKIVQKKLVKGLKEGSEEDGASPGDLNLIFEKFEHSGLKFKNRLCFCNLTDDFLYDNFGTIKESAEDFYVSVAKTGVSLIFTGGAIIGKNGIKAELSPFAKKCNYATIKRDGKSVALVKHINGRVRAAGAKIFLTLKPAFGRGDYSNQILNTFNISVYAHKNVFDASVPCARITDGKIKKIAREFAEAAETSRSMNFDGIMIDGSSFNILGEFSSEVFNRRTFGYFSSEFEFAELVLKNITKSCAGINIIYKITLASLLKEVFGKGVTKIPSLKKIKEFNEKFENVLNFMERLVKLGVNGFMIDFGTYETEFLTDFSALIGENLFNEIFSEIKRHFSNLDLKTKNGEPILLISNDNFNTITSMSRTLNGAADFVNVTKHLYSDNDFIKKLKEYDVSLKSNETETKTKPRFDVNPCIKCSVCNLVARCQGRVNCTVNPNLFGVTLNKTSRVNKRVAVVGAGVAGIVAALTLAERGFEVDLYDKNKSLNQTGRNCEIFNFDYKLAKFHDHIESLLNKKFDSGKINLRLGEVFSVGQIEKAVGEKKSQVGEYAGIFVATGFHEKFLDAVGAVLSNVKTIYEVIQNKNVLFGREKFVIYAKSELSFKLALYLSNEGKKVSLLVSDRDELKNMSNGQLTYFAHALKLKGVEVFIEPKIKRIEEDFVEIFVSNKLAGKAPDVKIISAREHVLPKFDARVKNLDCDLFIYEPELYPNNKLFYEIVKARFAGEVYLIGNALEISPLSKVISSSFYATKNF